MRSIHADIPIGKDEHGWYVGVVLFSPFFTFRYARSSSDRPYGREKKLFTDPWSLGDSASVAKRFPAADRRQVKRRSGTRWTPVSEFWSPHGNAESSRMTERELEDELNLQEKQRVAPACKIRHRWVDVMFVCFARAGGASRPGSDRRAIDTRALSKTSRLPLDHAWAVEWTMGPRSLRAAPRRVTPCHAARAGQSAPALRRLTLGPANRRRRSIFWQSCVKIGGPRESHASSAIQNAASTERDTVDSPEEEKEREREDMNVKLMFTRLIIRPSVLPRKNEVNGKSNVLLSNPLTDGKRKDFPLRVFSTSRDDYLEVAQRWKFPPIALVHFDLHFTSFIRNRRPLEKSPTDVCARSQSSAAM